jgi:hypothetical protein
MAAQEEVRHRLRQFVARRKYGAIARVCEISGVTRNWVAEFRDGKDIALKSVNAIESALDKLEHGAPLVDSQARENPSNYGKPDTAKHMATPQERAVFEAIADDLESVAKRLRDPSYSKERKVQRLRKWLADAQDELNALIPETTSRTPRPTGQRK